MECASKLSNDETVFKAFTDLFDYLPLATMIYDKTGERKILVVHGGIWGRYKETDKNGKRYDLDWISENIKKPEDLINSREHVVAKTQSAVKDSD